MLDLYFNGECVVQQIIPAAPGLFELDKDDSTGEVYKLPIVAFALVRDKRGNQEVVPLSMDDFGDVDSARGNRIILEPVMEAPKADG